jgi:hypothetical protein
MKKIRFTEKQIEIIYKSSIFFTNERLKEISKLHFGSTGEVTYSKGCHYPQLYSRNISS